MQGTEQGVIVNVLSVINPRANYWAICLPSSLQTDDPYQTQSFVLPLKRLGGGPSYWLMSSHQIGLFIFMRELAERGRACQAIPSLWLRENCDFLGGGEGHRALGAGGKQLQRPLLLRWHLGYPRAELRLFPALHRKIF